MEAHDLAASACCLASHCHSFLGALPWLDGTDLWPLVMCGLVSAMSFCSCTSDSLAGLVRLLVMGTLLHLLPLRSFKDVICELPCDFLDGKLYYGVLMAGSIYVR
jgi:hypothetical protein